MSTPGAASGPRWPLDLVQDEMFILAVDDKPANLTALDRTLAGVPATIIKATSGEEALAATLNYRFALAILDVQMPGMDGFELAEILLNDSATARMPIILVTAAYSDHLHLSRAYTSGAVDYLSKPYDPEILVSKVRVFLELAQARMTLEATVTARSSALRETEERYRLLFENMSQGAVYQDHTGRIVDANPAAARIMGLTRDQMMSPARWPGIMAIHEDGSHFPASEHPPIVTLKTGKALSGVIMGIRRDHQPDTWISIDTTPIVEPGGQTPHHVFTTFSDITARRLAERQVAESEESMRALLENISDGILLIDLGAGVVKYANPAWTRLMNCEGNCAGCDGCAQRVFPVLDEASLTQLRLADRLLPPMRWAAHHILDLSVPRLDGSRLIVDAAISRLMHGGASCLLAVCRDTTERRAAEAERQRLQAELFQAQKMESIGSLAGGVAHDFNNLLTAILGYTELALGSLDEDHPIREDLREVRSAGERSAALTRQLLAFGRRQVMERAPIVLNDVLHTMEKMLRRIIGEDVNVLFVLDPSPTEVFADAGQLEQVVMNLAVNARDAMPNGGRMTVSTDQVLLTADDAHGRKDVPAGAYVRLRVTDTGCGMTPETMARMFEPFFTTKGPGKGTGLGLATVYGIVRQNEGYLSATSQVGAGSTFEVLLPAMAVTTADAGGPPAAVAADERPRGGSETILVVEDEAQVRRLAVRSLEFAGFRVLQASEGASGLALCQAYEGPIHLALTDVVMPQMGGEEFASRLATIRPDTRVLFMSGYTGRPADDRADDGSAFPHLVEKPFSPESLIGAVRSMLDGREPGRVKRPSPNRVAHSRSASRQ